MVKKRNSYWYFMKHHQDQAKQEGRWISLTEAANECSAKWNAMTADQRKPYEDQARGWQPSTEPSTIAKVQSLPIEQEDASNQFLKENVKRMKSSGQLLDAKWLVLATNVVMVTQEGDHLPNELALVEFSIRSGVGRRWHHFVDPGRPPQGLARVAFEHANETHKIPEGYGRDAKNYNKIIAEMKKFLSASGDVVVLTPKFLNEDYIVQSSGVLNWLEERDNDNFAWPVIHDLVSLASLIGQAYNWLLPSSAVEFRLNAMAYDFVSGLYCEFHEDQDNHFCALAIAYKWAFLFLDLILPVTDVQLSDGHRPAGCERFAMPPQIVEVEIKQEKKDKADDENQKPKQAADSPNSGLTTNKQNVSGASAIKQKTDNDNNSTISPKNFPNRVVGRGRAKPKVNKTA